jgi:hypothetical protein
MRVRRRLANADLKQPLYTLEFDFVLPRGIRKAA